MIQTNETLYSVHEILQEQVTDFDIVREKPLTFMASGKYLVCAPVRYYNHGRFVQELTRLLTNYYEIFQKVEFVTSANFKNENEMLRAVQQVTLFSASKDYRKFIAKEIPAFIKRWAYTIRGKRIVKIRNAKRLLKGFSSDELLQVFFAIFVFNYDIVKKKTFDFLSRIRSGNLRNPMSLDSSISTVGAMPRYSKKRYSKSDLDLFAKQSKLN